MTSVASQITVAYLQPAEYLKKNANLRQTDPHQTVCVFQQLHLLKLSLTCEVRKFLALKLVGL